MPEHPNRASSACTQCGEALDHPGTFHPHALCVLKQAFPRQSSWETLRQTVAPLGIRLPERAPLVRELPMYDDEIGL